MTNILSQEEIDALLSAAEKGELDDDGSVRKGGDSEIAPYNFRRPNLITKDQLRDFSNLQDNFARDVQTSLSLLMRATVEFKMVSSEQQQYYEFTSSLPTISHLCLYSADPLPGLITIEVNLALLFGLVDFRLGGSGQIETAIRQATEVEISLVDPFITKVMEHLETSWKNLVPELSFVHIRTESNPEYLQAAPADAPMVVLAFDVKVGESSGIINICYPVPMILNILDVINRRGGQMDNYYGKQDAEDVRNRILDNLRHVPLTGAVKLGKAKLLGREILKLAPGDVIVLDKRLGTPLTCDFAGKTLFTGYPGKMENHVCFKIKDRYRRDEED